MPSAQAIKSGVPLGVTGAYTTPSTGWLLWSNSKERAGSFDDGDYGWEDFQEVWGVHCGTVRRIGSRQCRA